MSSGSTTLGGNIPQNATFLSVTTPVIYDPSHLSSIDMVNQTLKDTAGVIALDWSNTVDTGRVLNDEFGNVCVGFSATANLTGRALFDDTGNANVDWGNCILGSPTGGGVFWKGLRLSDAPGFTSIDWGVRTLRDAVPSIQLSWGNAVSFGDPGVKLHQVTASRVLVTNASQIIIAANPTLTEINYVSGVTSAIQTQLNAKRADAYTPGTPARWAGNPTTIQQAIDRIAAVVGAITPIP